MTAVLTAAESPPPPDDGLPPGQPYVSPDDLASIPPLFEAAAQQALLPLVAQIWQESAGKVHAQLVDAADLPNLPQVSSLAAETYLAQASNTFAQVGDDLWNTARSELLAGFQAGESIPQLSTRLRNTAGLTARKATLVARTQVLDASNAGSYATAQTAGIDGLRKGWLDTPDQRTRPTHRAAGATYGSDEGMIPLADQFTVGGYSCDRPHDPTLPAGERYSCRCALIYSMGPAAVRTAQDEAVPAAPLPNTSGQLAPVLPVEVTPAEAAAAQAAKISEAVGSPPVTRQLAAQAKITPRAMADLDSVHIPALGSADGDAYLASKNGAAHAYYTPLGSHPSVYATAEAATDNPLPAIWFNPHWNGNRLGGTVRKGIDSGWYTPAPADLAPLERTLAHEYGHHVTNVLFEAPNFNGTADMAGAVAQRVLGPINEALGANRASAFARNGDLLEPIHWGSPGDLHFSVHGDLLDAWVQQNKDLIAAKVSQYGAKNFDEFLAEVWQEYSTMGAGARPHIQTIGALLRDVTEELRAGGGTLRTAAEVTQLAEAPLSSRTVIQLRALAKERGIPGYSKLTKPQLVERLSGAPPAVAELPLAARRITELRTLAKQRDLTVPPRATKADLIKALEAPPAAPIGPGGFAEGAAALESAPASLVTGRGLTTAQKSALRHYQDQGAHDRINNALRRGEDVSKMARVTQIDAALDSSPLRTNVIVERGVSGENIFGDPDSWPSDLTGFEWTDRAYLSTSAQTRSARGFGGEHQVVLRLHVPAGTRGVTMSRFERPNGLPDEAELLLERGLNLRVTADRMVFDPSRGNPAYQYVRTLDVDVLPRGGVLLKQPTVAERNAAQRAAARERNKLIEARAAVEQTLAELDDLLFKKASREVFEQRIALAQLDGKDLAALRSALDDPVKLRAQVTRISKKQGITVTGRAGAKVKYDPELHDPVGEVPAPGTPMVVIRRGSTVTVDGEKILLNKAVVKLPTAPARKAAAKATGEPAVSGKAAHQAALIRQTIDPDMVTTIEEYHGGWAAGMNRALRLGRGVIDPANRDALRLAKGMDELMTGQELATSIAVDRGVIYRELVDLIGAEPRRGATFVDHGFVSTTTVGRPRLQVGEENAVLHIRVPAGVRAASTPPSPSRGFDSFDPGEVVLDRGLTYRVVRVETRDDGLRHIDIEVVPKPARKAAPRKAPAKTAGRLTPARFDSQARTAASGNDALTAAPKLVRFDEQAGKWIVDGVPDPAAAGQAVHDYWDFGQDVNRYLRDGAEAFGRKGEKLTAAQVRKTIDGLDQIFDHSHLDRPVVTWRGFGGRTVFGDDPDLWPDNLAGREWTDKAYVSTAVDRMEAANFVTGGSAGVSDFRGVMARILLPRGGPVLSMSEFEAGEMLLSRGWRFRVIRDHGWVEDRRKSGTRFQRLLDLQAIPPGGVR